MNVKLTFQKHYWQKELEILNNNFKMKKDNLSKMKRVQNLIVALTAVLVLSNCSSKQKENDWTRENLKGKVSAYAEMSFEAVEKFGEIEEGKRKRFGLQEYDYIKTFDENGNLLEWDNYTMEDILFEKEKYSYDKNCNLIEKSQYNADGALTSKYKFGYDKKGNCIEENFYMFDGELFSRDENNYDESGNKTESSHYIGKSLFSKHVNTYDTNGYIIGSKSYDDQGSLKGTERYVFDSNGNRKEFSRYNADGSLKYRSTYTYDENGNITASEFFKSDGSLGYINSYTYEYDEHGNWLKKIAFKDKVAQYILEREYEYF